MRIKAVCMVAALTATGCAMGPKYHVPSVAVPPAYQEAGRDATADQSWKVASPQDATHRGDWWLIFDDAELNALHHQVDEANQTIVQAYENYMAARALVGQARALRVPTVTTNLGVSRSQSSATIGGADGSPADGPGPVTNFGFPIAASWEPDVWGRVRNTINQYRYAAEVSAADLQNVRLVQHSTLAQLYFLLRGQDTLQMVLAEIVAADQRLVDYARAQYETGIGTRISLVEAQTALQTAEAASIGIGVARAQYLHAIAVLVGRPPAELSLPQRRLDAVPPEVPPGVPSELLERRPDIAAAERQMAQANAQLGLAHAAYYPTVSISASAGFASSSLSQWLSWPSRLWSLGTSAVESIFDGGLRRAAVQQSTAVYNANVASYRQTVLTAFQQVEDGLAAERILALQMAKQQEAVASAREFLRLAFDRYQAGIDSYLNVLTAQTVLLAAEQTLTTLQTERMTSIVQLIAALGGGWDRSHLPE